MGVVQHQDIQIMTKQSISARVHKAQHSRANVEPDMEIPMRYTIYSILMSLGLLAYHKYLAIWKCRCSGNNKENTFGDCMLDTALYKSAAFANHQ
jgi:hypothetical protein